MGNISEAEANQLADLLNQICSATLDALHAGDVRQRLAVAGSLRQFRAQFEADSEVGGFVLLLAQWLEGERPNPVILADLDAPFRRALSLMLQSVTDETPQIPQAPQTPQAPISGRVLAQLLAAIVAAHAAQDEAIQRELAAQLVNIHAQLDREWKPKLGPLLENLRMVLGGADPRLLPAVPDPHYQNLWYNTVGLLAGGADLSEEGAHHQLLERLVHNTLFVLRSDTPDLTTSFLRALLDVQREALEQHATPIATLVGAIRAHLQGIDATPFTVLLADDELAAWQRILEGSMER